ncbi:uncharacterized protein LOC120015038 isoform X2 [Tripterygium wilfordii]|uniref:uncharacterized protein LOC120015038 isoform X2 n=1 Tax=Tripterygium wilfordii TaxID=458696 RepID=UPI0018F85651|nr:uncharacterized protein LOC120015038 isoform X2 [Tripterygium wilfordii]
MDKKNVPFNVGQLVESRSFVPGYRGAWFRCKIRDIHRRKNGLGIDLEYFDFPDEKVRWTKLYQKHPASGSKMDSKRQLMARPHFPPVYQESLKPDISTISEVVVIVNDVWKVGDLVDWFSDGCFWSGRITEMLGSEKFQIELLPPPYGEGLPYEVSSKDLRPSLEWSPEHGWTVPLPLGNEPRHYCARLIRPVDTEDAANLMVDVGGEGRRGGREAAGASLEKSVSLSSHASESSLPASKSRLTRKRFLSVTATGEQSMPGTTSKFDKADNELERASCSDNISSSHVPVACIETAGTGTVKDSSDWKVGGISIDSMYCETIEDALSGLEELVNRVKWTKGLLQSGMSSSKNVSWKFVEHLA